MFPLHYYLIKVNELLREYTRYLVRMKMRQKFDTYF